MTDFRNETPDVEAQVRSVIAQLQTLDSLEDIKACLNRTLPPMGYAYYTYLAVDIGARQDRGLALVQTDSIVLTNLEPPWRKRYVERRYLESDPIVLACYRSRSPLIWSALDRAEELQPEQQEMLADAAAHGICRGITIPVHGFAGEVGILSLYSAVPDEAFLTQAQSDELSLQRMAFALHDLIHRRFVRRSAGVAVVDFAIRRPP
jgi:hypothetical protein